MLGKTIYKNIKEKFIQCLQKNPDFNNQELDHKLRYTIINLTVGLAIFGLIFGAINNYFKMDYLGVRVNIIAIVVLLTTLLLLRFYKKQFEFMTSLLTIEFIILFDLLIIISHPSDLKHIWLMTFPALIFFYKGTATWLMWVGVFILSLFLLKVQTIRPTAYTLHEIAYIAVVIVIMTIVIYFYKARIDQGNITIKRQKEQLEALTKELETKVLSKTQELTTLNLSLENMVEEKVKELIKKDALILAQSRQAAMGEMISMIAHQWRQPLSTITLQISNIKINSMLGKGSIQETNNALEHISDTIIYLSETIDDFQSFFKPNKQQELRNVCELVERGTNFTKPRLKIAEIDLRYSCMRQVSILTYPNEFAQVIINIINNSVDVLLERQITSPTISVNIDYPDDFIAISITDNAGGIDTKIIDKIFEPYFSTKGKNGTGLGLYMSKIIIEKELNGELLVQNTPIGAEFIVKIPHLS